jgi:cytidyltransferase-like protein
MRISELFESVQNQVVIYPGRFQPFHKGHAAVYKWLAGKFDNVFISTSNKVEPPRSPFNFEEKKLMMTHAGVPADAIVQVKNPYIADEITSRFDPENTVAIFAVSEKDMAEDPRFQFKPKKDGSPSYYQAYGGEMQPLSKHGYILTVPTFDFTILGEPMRSATELRRNFANADSDTQARMIKDLYGKYDPAIHQLMATKLAQQ